MAKEPSPTFRRAAERAADQPFFLAGVLRDYASAHQLDEPALATMLGCAAEDLPRLALCRRPRADAAGFRADIQHLAARFGLHAEQLAHVIREADALAAIAHQPAQTHGTRPPGTPQQPARHMLRAARDRDEVDDEDEADPPVEDA